MTGEDDRGATTGFLLMPFVQDLAWLDDEVRRAGSDAGITIERADDISEPGVIVDQIVEKIEQADLVVAVLTGQNPNVFFELGVAWRWHEPVLVADTAHGLPFDVQHRRAVLYGTEDSNEGRLRTELRKALEAAATSPRLPRGRRVRSEQRNVAALDLNVLDGPRKHSKKLEILNRGTVTMHEVTIEFPEGSGWQLSTDTLASYPIREIAPGRSKRALLSPPGLGHAPVAQATVRGTTAHGQPYEDHIEVSTL